MDFLAFPVMADANENPLADNVINLPKVKFNFKGLRNSTWLALAGVFVLMGTLSHVEAASAANYVRTNGSCLRVRTRASLSAPVVKCVRNGTRLAPIVGYRNGFAKLSTGRYVSANFVGRRPGRGNTPGLGVGGTVNLSFGSRGAAVRRIQEALGVSPTGYFGSETARAVRDFQASNGLTTDGVVGPATRRAILSNAGGFNRGFDRSFDRSFDRGFDDDYYFNRGRNRDRDLSYNDGRGRGGRRTLALGSKGPAVSQVQEALGVPVTGYFGPVTVNAVRDFQASNGLPVTGRVGTQTFNALGIGVF